LSKDNKEDKMRKLMKVIIIILLISTPFMLGSSNGDGGCKRAHNNRRIYRAEQNNTIDNQARLNAAQPPVFLNWSLERENINKRTKLWNDPNKVSYIYLINYGKIMAFFTIKGKVSSVNSQVTNTSQIVSNPADTGASVIPSPSGDGSYGTNGDAIFFFTTENAYVEWKGDFMVSDQPLKLTQQPGLIRNIN
jgi:hypothetical protein